MPQVCVGTNNDFERNSKLQFTSVWYNILKGECLMSKLRIIDNLKILEEANKVAVEASLVCDCGNEWFHVLHTGKKTKGFLRPWLVKNNKMMKNNII